MKDTGEISFCDADTGNIPVSIFLSKELNGYSLTADNYMPRKERIETQTYKAESEDLDELKSVIKENVIPLYQGALTKLYEMLAATDESLTEDSADLYYW